MGKLLLHLNQNKTPHTTHLITQFRRIHAHFTLIQRLSTARTLATIARVTYKSNVKRNLIPHRNKILVRGAIVILDVLAVFQGEVLSRQLKGELLVTILFARCAELWHFVGREEIKVTLDLIRGENAGRRPRVAELFRLDLGCFRVGLQAESVLDILQLLMVDLVIFAWTFARLTGFSVGWKRRAIDENEAWQKGGNCS